jgi:hypothetical protein
MRAIPGIRAAALGNTVPAAGYWGDFVFTVKEHPPLKAGEDLPEALVRWADPDYFSALGIPLVNGRFFTGLFRGCPMLSLYLPKSPGHFCDDLIPFRQKETRPTASRSSVSSP